MRIIRMIVGMLLLAAGLPILLAAGGLWTVAQHRDPGGAFRADLEQLDVPGQALIIEDLDGLLRRDAAFARTGRTELRITATAGDGPAFVGLAPATAATGYLQSARHSRFEHLALTNGPLPVRVSAVSGGLTGDPGRQEFWTRSGEGSLAWTADEIRDRDLALVIMSADGRPAGPVTVTAELRPDWLTAATWGGLGAGLLLIIVGMAVLAWPSRPRELVYLVDPAQFPEVEARLGRRTSVIRLGDDGMVITTAGGRPIRGGRTATLLADHGTANRAAAGQARADPAAADRDAADRGADAPDRGAVESGVAADRGVNDQAAAADRAAAEPGRDLVSGAGLATGGITVAGAGLPAGRSPAAGGSPAVGDSPTAGGSRAAGGSPADSDGTRPEGWTRPRPPVTPRLNWPPLTRDPAQDTQPPIPADPNGAPGTEAVPTAPEGATVAAPKSMPTASATAAAALDAHTPTVAELREADGRIAAEAQPHAVSVPEARPAPGIDVAGPDGGGAVEPAAPRRKRAAPTTRTPAKRSSAARSDVNDSIVAPALGVEADADGTRSNSPSAGGGRVTDAPVKRQPRRAASPKSESPAEAGHDVSAPAPRIGRRRKAEPAEPATE
ncbi:hypothetical protein ACIA8K_10690 [Catenuloplanes sp. NPDC051500]|uniref:hypothetical protein n=1 Tax=Catenuloplanes sp. NPDC051500 TaxID=3363959 RepID=UPI003788CEB7